MESIIVFVIALIVAVVAIYWIILKNSAAKIASNYQQLAKHFDLELQRPAPKMAGLIRPEPSVYGNYRNREVSISVPGKGLQGTRQVESVLKVGVHKDDLRAQLTATGLLAGMSQRDSGGQKRWKSGNAAFDNPLMLGPIRVTP